MKKAMADRRRWVLVTAMLSAALGVVAAALTWTDAALALYGVAGIATFVWVVLWARSLNDLVMATRRDVRKTATRLKADAASRADHDIALDDLRAQIDGLGRAVNQVGAAVEHQSPALHRLMDELRETMMSVQRVPSASVELGRVYDSLVDHGRPMPELGNWAMSPRALVWFVDRISTTPVTTIVECGSGSSTVWFATAFERRGGPGRVVSLESSAEYAEETRARVAALGLSHRAEVIHAPLVETTVPGRDPHPWYDLSTLPGDLDTIDILFVDGPVGAIAPQVRYPGYPLLADRLTTDSIVVLDDTGRPDEQGIIDGWLQERPFGRRIAVSERLDKSTVFSVEID